MEIESLLTRLSGVKSTATGWMARCPAHEDEQASLSVHQGDGGRTLLKCFAGCSVESVVGSVGLKMADLFPEPTTHRPARRVVATYDYTDESGTLVFQCVRFEPKGFCQRRPDPDKRGDWIWNLQGVHTVLYRLPEVRKAVAQGQTVYLVEGEKDADALIRAGLAATCNPMGAGKWMPDYTESLRDCECVVIIADKDGPGRKHASAVAKAVQSVAALVKVIELPDRNGQPVKDAADWLAAGGTLEELAAIVNATPAFSGPTASPPVQGMASEQSGSPSSEATTSPAQVEADIDESRPFPVELLPPAMARMVLGLARAERVPLALPAICVLGTVSAAIGAGIEVVSAVGRTTRANLFLLGSAESGSGKSQVFRRAVEPLHDHQHQVQEQHKLKTLPRIASELAVLAREIGDLEKKAAKASEPSDRSRLLGELEYRNAQRDEFQRKAVMPCVVCGDVTSEKLAVLLAENGEVMWSASAEARQIVDIVCGRYSATKTTDEALYLSAFSGDQVRVDRLGRDPVTLRRPCLGTLWLVQPDALGRLFGTEGLAVSGFLPRILVCETRAVPQKTTGGTIESVGDDVRIQYASLVAGLVASYHAAQKAYQIEATAGTKQLLDEFFNAIVDRRSGDLADVGAFASRYAEQAWRVALVLHCGLHGSTAHTCALDAETATHAIGVVEWFIEEQLRILAKSRHVAAEKIENSVLELLEKNRVRKAQDYVSARDLYRARIVGTPDAAVALLERMAKDGFLAGQELGHSSGGRPTRIYRRIQNPVPA